MNSKIKFFILIFFLSVFAKQAQEGWYYQTPSDIKDIAFVAENKIVAVGRGIWISTNLEQNWEEIYSGYNQEMTMAGNYKAVFSAQVLSSGIYIYNLKTNNRSLSNKMLLLK